MSAGMHKRWRSVVVRTALLGCALATGCGEGGTTEPLRLEGSFALHAANNQALPANSLDWCREPMIVQFVSGSLRFFGSDSVERVTQVRSGTEPTQPPVVRTDTASVAVAGEWTVFQ